MNYARMLSLVLGISATAALANEEVAVQPEGERAKGSVMAMDVEHARAFHQGELITSGANPLTLVTRQNLRAELSPHSVAEFDDEGLLRDV